MLWYDVQQPWVQGRRSSQGSRVGSSHIRGIRGWEASGGGGYESMPDANQATAVGTQLEVCLVCVLGVCWVWVCVGCVLGKRICLQRKECDRHQLCDDTPSCHPIPLIPHVPPHPLHPPQHPTGLLCMSQWNSYTVFYPTSLNSKKCATPLQCMSRAPQRRWALLTASCHWHPSVRMK